MLNGTSPNIIDHRDYDFFATHAGGIQTPNFPKKLIFNNDWVPSQYDNESVFKNPPMFYGCTNYTTCDVCANQDGLLYNPAFTEALTGANAKGGYGVRDSLLTAINIGTKTQDGVINKRSGLFNIQKYSNLDWFDSLRFAMLIPDEECTISIGTPWFPNWERDAQNGVSVMSNPSSFNLAGIPWHNSEIIGFDEINGIPYLVNKSWQGTSVGDNGLLYFPREVVNAVMSIQGTCSFTVTRMGDKPIRTIDVTFTQFIISAIRNIFTMKTPPVVPQNASQSTVSSLCDTMCLAIQEHEGYYEGSRSFRNCNPGNLRYAGQKGSTGKDDKNFAIFPDYQTGYNALKGQILLVANGKSKVYPNPCTLEQFFNVYAPSSENDTLTYINFVATKMRVTKDYQLSNLI